MQRAGSMSHSRPLPDVGPLLLRLTSVASLAAAVSCAGSDRIPVTGESSGTGASPGATGSGPGAGGATGGGGDPGSGGRDTSAEGAQGATGAGGGADVSSAGGGGGAPPAEVCGDGAVEGVEECDDGNPIDGDGCSICVVDCAPPGTKHPVTGHCYQVFPDATTWPFAEANCAAWGGAPGLGHLASLGGQGEHDLVYSLITAQTWIGIQDPVVEGDYQWSDGTPWAFESWAPGEPDNTYEEDCAFMRTTDEGGWNDHACGDTRPAYVCERRAAGTF